MKGFRARAVPWERCERLKNSNHPSRLIHASFRSHLESVCCVLTSGVWSGRVNPTHWTRLLLSAHPWCRGLFPHLSPTLFPVIPTTPTRTPSLAQPRPAPSGGTRGTRMGLTYCPCPLALQPGTRPQRGVLNHPQWLFLPLFAQPHSEAKTCHVSSSKRKTQASIRTRTYKTLFTTYIRTKPDFILCFLRAARSVCQGTPFRKGGDVFFP